MADTPDAAHLADADVADEDGGPESSEPDLPPPEPLYEAGLVIPEQAIPCFDADTGEQAGSCNHHGSSVAVQPDGTVLVAWYHGIGEKSRDSAIYWSRRPPGGAFSDAELLFDEPGKAEGNPVLWVHDQTAELYLFFITLVGPSWNDGQIRLMRSSDGGATWTDPVTIREELTWMTRNHPVRMADGELLLPCYSEALYVPSFIWSADDFHATWQEHPFDSPFVLSHMAAIQPTVIVRDDGSLFALMRQTASTADALAWQMTSDDNARTWSDTSPSAIPNDSVAFEMVRLRSGRVAVAFDNTLKGRYPLAAALSEDEGRTWTAVAHLNDDCPNGGCSYGYASLAQDPTDESLWVTYTHNRDTIGWVHLNEAWLLAQEPVPLAWTSAAATSKRWPSTRASGRATRAAAGTPHGPHPPPATRRGRPWCRATTARSDPAARPPPSPARTRARPRRAPARRRGSPRPDWPIASGAHRGPGEAYPITHVCGPDALNAGHAITPRPHERCPN